MSLGGTTGYAINQLVTLDQELRILFGRFLAKVDLIGGYSWVPVIGPIMGGALGALGYNAIINGELGMWFWVFAVLFVLILILTMQLDKKKDLA